MTNATSDDKIYRQSAKKPTKTNTEPNPIGTRVNPADPRIGITLDTTGGTVYFKLTETLKGQEAENRLLQMNQSLEEIKQGEYEHTGTTLVLFVYDVQAVNGFAAYPLYGLDIINSYTLYDRTCSKNIKNIESFYLSEGYASFIYKQSVIAKNYIKLKEIHILQNPNILLY